MKHCSWKIGISGKAPLRECSVLDGTSCARSEPFPDPRVLLHSGGKGAFRTGLLFCQQWLGRAWGLFIFSTNFSQMKKAELCCCLGVSSRGVSHRERRHKAAWLQRGAGKTHQLNASFFVLRVLSCISNALQIFEVKGWWSLAMVASQAVCLGLDSLETVKTQETNLHGSVCCYLPFRKINS